MPLVGESGTAWGMALVPKEEEGKKVGVVTNPVFVSIGHRVSLETCVTLTKAVGRCVFLFVFCVFQKFLTRQARSFGAATVFSESSILVGLCFPNNDGRLPVEFSCVALVSQIVGVGQTGLFSRTWRVAFPRELLFPIRSLLPSRNECASSPARRTNGGFDSGMLQTLETEAMERGMNVVGGNAKSGACSTKRCPKHCRRMTHSGAGCVRQRRGSARCT